MRWFNAAGSFVISAPRCCCDHLPSPPLKIPKLTYDATAIPALSKAILQAPDPYQHFLPLLAHSNNSDDPITLLTSTVLVSLMASSRDESAATVDRALPTIFSYLASLTKNADAGLQDIGVQECSSLLYGHVSRQQFWAQRSETVAPLIDILRAAAGVANGNASATLWSGTTNAARSGFEGSLGGGVGLQLLYHVLLVLWQLSFEAEDVSDDLNEYVSAAASR